MELFRSDWASRFPSSQQPIEQLNHKFKEDFGLEESYLPMVPFLNAFRQWSICGAGP